MTGEGIDEFFEAVKGAVEEYDTEYKVQMREHLAKKKAEEERRQEEQMSKFREDLEATGALPTEEEAKEVKSFLDMMS